MFSIASMTVDGEKYFYLYDGLGSVTEVIDSDENVVNRYRYSPFGESLLKEETVFNPYQFTGRRYDEESGQYYYRARMYSAEQARFTSSDPAKDGANWYAYVGNNPTNHRDPSGKWVPIAAYDGGGGGSSGYDITECPLDSSFPDYAGCVDSFMNSGYSAGASTSCCIDVCYETGWCNIGGSGGGITLGPTAECILDNLGISVMTNPLSYGICAAALIACGVSGTVTGGTSLMICVSAYASGALAACTVAGVEFIGAVAPCL